MAGMIKCMEMLCFPAIVLAGRAVQVVSKRLVSDAGAFYSLLVRVGLGVDFRHVFLCGAGGMGIIGLLRV